MAYFLQQFINVLQTGSTYSLIALGYTMVYGVLSMINFAHGDIFMVGAFLFYLFVSTLKLPFLPSMLAATVLTALLGVATERFAYRPLRGAPKMSAIITALGVGVLLEHLTLAINPYPRHIPAMFVSGTWNAGGVVISQLKALIIILSLVLMALLDFTINKTKLGMAIRAISWDMSVVPLMGVSVNGVIAATFAIGAGLGGIAGVLYSLAYPVINPYMGVMIGWKAFISAVIGGIGNVRGAIVGGYVLGLVETLTIVFLPATYRDVAAFSLLLVLLIYRPYGLMGRPKTFKV